MAEKELRYIDFDPDSLWQQMMAAYIDEGGDILYPGDEKEMLLRGVQSILIQAYAQVDTALKMDTLRYAVGEYLDIYGEKRSCVRNPERAASLRAVVEFSASGIQKTLRAGTLLTADGEVFYRLTEDIPQTGQAGTAEAVLECTRTGSIGNGLTAGASLQFYPGEAGVEAVTALADASGGQAEETDESYRERIRTYGMSGTTTGTKTQYEAAAKGVSSEIVDASAVNGGAGQVNIYLLLKDETGAAGIVAGVQSALDQKDVRPLTDTVTVSLAQKKEYTLHVTCYQESGENLQAAAEQAAAQYTSWQNERIGRAFNPDKLIALLYQAGAQRVTVDVQSEFDGNAAVYTPIAYGERCFGTVEVVVTDA